MTSILWRLACSHHPPLEAQSECLSCSKPQRSIARVSAAARVKATCDLQARHHAGGSPPMNIPQDVLRAARGHIALAPGSAVGGGAGRRLQEFGRRRDDEK